MKQHKFTHIGKAPYTLVGYIYDAPWQDHYGAWHGGQHSCDHCGRPISHVFICKSSDGKEFNLGSVHVEDLGDAGLTQAVQTKVKEIRAEARRKQREEEYAKFRAEQEKREAKARKEADKRQKKLQAEFDRVLPIAETMPHPNAYFAKKGQTLKDYILYFARGSSRWNDLRLAPEPVKSALRQAGFKHNFI